MEEDQDMLPKYSFTIMGDPTVGKSNITSRFIHDDFSDDYNPTLQGNYTRKIPIGQQVYVVNVTDTAGQEKYVTMEGFWIVDKDGFVFVFAIDNQSSYESVVKKIQQHLQKQKQKKIEQKTPFILVGNKIDLYEDRKVNSLKCQRFVQRHNIKYLEVSAKKNINIENIFIYLIKENEVKKHIISQPRQNDSKSFSEKISEVCKNCVIF